MAAPLSERFVNNFFTIAVARVAMITTPILVAIFGWAAVQMWDSYTKERAAISDTLQQHTLELQDHESRLKFSAAQAESFQKAVGEKFIEIGVTLKDLNTQLSAVNGSIIRLQTTIENRLPPRRADNDGTQGAP